MGIEKYHQLLFFFYRLYIDQKKVTIITEFYFLRKSCVTLNPFSSLTPQFIIEIPIATVRQETWMSLKYLSLSPHPQPQTFFFSHLFCYYSYRKERVKHWDTARFRFDSHTKCNQKGDIFTFTKFWESTLAGKIWIINASYFNCSI